MKFKGAAGKKFRFGMYDILAYLVVIFAILACILPFMHILSLSLSSVRAVNAMAVRLLPVEFTLQTYDLIIRDAPMIRSLFFTIMLVLVYITMSMFVTVSAAFALNKKRLAGRRFFMTLMIITMYFSGGIIPEYINMKNLDLINKFWSLVLPGLLSVYNMIIMRSFFNSNIPASIEESATIDGCSDFGVLLRIIIPLSKPVLATITLFYAVGRWNGFMDALMYINKPELYPLQLKLYQIIFNSMSLDIMQNEGAAASLRLPPDSLKSASVIFTTLPILLIYPYLQKHFVTGVTLGSIKE
jgi:putative aldouronate transport system permease protein